MEVKIIDGEPVEFPQRREIRGINSVMCKKMIDSFLGMRNVAVQIHLAGRFDVAKFNKCCLKT